MRQSINQNHNEHVSDTYNYDFHSQKLSTRVTWKMKEKQQQQKKKEEK